MSIITYSQAIYDAMREEMERDPNVILIGEDVGTFGGVWGVSGDLMKVFGEDRVRDTPISEAAIVGAGLGAAMMGLRPIVEIMFGDFLPVAGDQLVNQLAKARYMSGGKAKVPVTVRITTGAPGSSAAQHSQSPEGWLMNVPGLKIATPATPADAKGPRPCASARIPGRRGYRRTRPQARSRVRASGSRPQTRPLRSGLPARPFRDPVARPPV